MQTDPAAPGLRLDVIGAGPAYTDRPGATGAAYLVRDATTSILLDLGQGSFPRLAGLVDPATIDAIVVSHLHPDHFVDLVPMRHYLRWGGPDRRRIRVLGPAGLADRLDGLHAEPGFSAAALDTERLGQGVRQVGTLTVEAVLVTHTDESYGVRVSRGDHGLVYSGDCGRAEDLDVLIRAGDDLLCEVSLGAGPAQNGGAHLDGPAVGALAARTGVRRLFLTHLLMGHSRPDVIASVVARFDGPVELVDPGDRFIVAD